MQELIYIVCVVIGNILMFMYKAKKTSMFKIVTVERYLDPPICVLYRKYKIVFSIFPWWRKVHSKVIFRTYKEAEEAAFAVNKSDFLLGFIDNEIPEITSEVRKFNV